MAKRPRPIAVGPVRVRVVRGPHAEDARRWYWRAERYQDGSAVAVWAGWGTADEASRAVAALVAEGGDAAPRRDARRSPDTIATVGDLLAYWLGAQRERADISQRTVDDRASAVSHLTEIIGGILVHRLDSEALARYRDARIRGGGATSTTAHELGIARQAWRWGRERGYVPDRDIRPPAVRIVPVRCRRTPTPEDISAVYARLREPWERRCYALLAATGARLGEIASLTWERVDLESAEVHVRGKS